MISKAGAERLTPLATATLVFAANAPDIDVLSYARGPYFALAFRRGLTHGWPALLVLPFVVAGAVLAWDRSIRRRRDPDVSPARTFPTLILASVGVLTHPALDWMNTYGMRWSLPFDGAWSYGDALFIVDPWIWLLLGGVVFLSSRPKARGLVAWFALAALASVLVMALMPDARLGWLATLILVAVAYRRGVPRTPRGDRALMGGACVILLAYVGILLLADAGARRDVMRGAYASGLEPRDVMVAPRRGNPFVSDVVVVTDTGYVPGAHRWRPEPRVVLFPERVVPLVKRPLELSDEEADAIASLARADRQVASYLVWSRYPYLSIERIGEGWLVRYADVRYEGQPSAGGLSGISVIVPNPPGPP